MGLHFHLTFSRELVHAMEEEIRLSGVSESRIEKLVGWPCGFLRKLYRKPPLAPLAECFAVMAVLNRDFWRVVRRAEKAAFEKMGPEDRYILQNGFAQSHAPSQLQRDLAAELTRVTRSEELQPGEVRDDLSRALEEALDDLNEGYEISPEDRDKVIDLLRRLPASER